MRSSDFLLQLKKALENELSAAQVQDNVEYYRNYIKEETLAIHRDRGTTLTLGTEQGNVGV